MIRLLSKLKTIWSINRSVPLEDELVNIGDSLQIGTASLTLKEYSRRKRVYLGVDLDSDNTYMVTFKRLRSGIRCIHIVRLPVINVNSYRVFTEDRVNCLSKENIEQYMIDQLLSSEYTSYAIDKVIATQIPGYFK